MTTNIGDPTANLDLIMAQIKALTGEQRPHPLVAAIAERLASPGNPMLGGNPVPMTDSLMALDANNMVRDFPIGLESDDY